MFVSERCLDMYGTNGHLFRQVTETPQGCNPGEYPGQSDSRGEALSTFPLCSHCIPFQSSLIIMQIVLNLY